MPTYKVISEPWPVGYPVVEHRRRLRGDASVRRLMTTVDAQNILTAVRAAIESGEHDGRGITSVEEATEFGALYASSEELNDLLRREEDGHHDQEPLHPDDWEDDEAVFDTAGFNDAVAQVAAKLGESHLPGLFLTIVSDLDGDHALIQVRDEATGNYLAKTAAMEDLIHDREATGWNAILSIADAILYQAQELV